MRFIRQFFLEKQCQNIDEWYRTTLGRQLFDDLKARLDPVLATTFGYHALLIGCPSHTGRLLDLCRVRRHFSLGNRDVGVNLQAYPSLLPIAKDSVDLVVLMHHLSNTAEPHAILREASRVLIPEGKLIIIEFNPLSLWGLRRLLGCWLDRVPWNRHYYTARRLIDWMQLLGFDQRRHYIVGHMLPIQRRSASRRFTSLESWLKNWFEFSGALNVLVFDKNISPMTPIRHRWVTRKLLPGRVARPSVGRGMKYDK